MSAAGRGGRFVVLEGIDGAGTTTQTALLAETLRSEGVRVRATREPSDGPIGALIRQVLSGRVVAPIEGGTTALGWEPMALLFAADRMDHVQCEIAPFVAQGGVVISDRYDASSLAYQSVTSGRAEGDPLAWIRVLNQRAQRPDLTIVLDISAEAAAARRSARGEAAQIYDANEVQRALAAFYKNLPHHMPGDRIAVLDADAPVDVVRARVLEVYRTAFAPH
ncbi:dTMP kinase [Pendulispora albinea]|uniref:Thymidylate kinase n=1 Tax=Pendulispora albinea TaxID=2741071 RepID=A0ABZ2M8I5_9BACT